MDKKVKFCNNCGNIGHYNRRCNLPKTSFGIIAISYDKEILPKILKIKENLEYNYLDIDNYNYLHINNIHRITSFYNSIKFLMIRRKHSLNYVEFIRGKYNTFDDAINMLMLMSKEEVVNIISNNFEDLWNNLWLENSKSHMKEFRKSKNKFKNFITSDNINEIQKLDLPYDEPEWCFPKGRKNVYEKSIDCAVREFKEETQYYIEKKDICKNIIPINETYTGTDDNIYKNVYYISLDIDTDNFNKLNNNEVSSVRWVNYYEASKLLRPYYKSKKQLINKLMMFLINLTEFNANNDILLG
tara:strand:- start:306 stop:1205 length:900 start_codon:yes stop_codon:yes gene_type:complete